MIDSHFHLWDINKDYYTWLTPSLKPLYKSFTFSDYKKENKNIQIDSCIVVQAAADIEESFVLLKKAQENEKIQGVIAWMDFLSPRALKDLNKLKESKYLKGLRPMLQDIEDINFINNTNFHEIFQTMQKENLIFEALIKEEHIENIINLSKKYPKLQIIINHCAKPEISKKIENTNFLKWSELIKEASLQNNISCKFSGLVTECTSKANSDMIQPYWEHILKCFTSKRIIWGSDWPVVNLNSSYKEWLSISYELLLNLKEEEKNNILHNNAKKIYKIKN